MGPSKSPQILTRSPNSLNTYKFSEQNQERRSNCRRSNWPKYMGQTSLPKRTNQAHMQIPQILSQSYWQKKLHEKESCTHIMHIPQNILHLIDKTLYEKESHSRVQIPFRFFQNQIDKILHDEKESSTHLHTFHRNISFTKVLPGSPSSGSIKHSYVQNNLTDFSTIRLTKCTIRIKHLLHMHTWQILNSQLDWQNTQWESSNYVVCRFDRF
jgi:hypothetical protein